MIPSARISTRAEHRYCDRRDRLQLLCYHVLSERRPDHHETLRWAPQPDWKVQGSKSTRKQIICSRVPVHIVCVFYSGRSVDNLSEPLLTKFEQLAEKQALGLAYLFPFPTYSMYIRALEKHKKNQNKKKHFMIVNGVLLLKRVMLKIVAIATKNKPCIEAADIFKFALPLLFF